MFDFIIVGQGIAGSMLAWFLTKAGKNAFIIDEFRANSASQIATGIINPITGKRLVKSWRIDELLPFAKKTYRELEAELGISILSETTIRRIFSNKEDYQFFRQKNELDELPDYVKPLQTIPSSFRDTDLGGIEIQGVCLVHYQLLLSAMRKWFSARQMLLEEKFQFDKLKLENGRVHYGNITASKIIFCEGSEAIHNLYFSKLPFNFAKGEVLTVEIPGYNQDKIWHKGIFITPVADGFYRVGATYEWNFEDALPSQQGRQELEKKLKRAINLPYNLIGQLAAIRPTVVDRRPLIGLHPEFYETGIFNGMGTKGASLAPFFAKNFTDFLASGKPLDTEVDVQRFFT